MANLDLQNRAPSVTRTPDFRNHVERRYDALNSIPKTPADILALCWLPLGTVDEEYDDCYLIEQRVEGQTGDFYEPCKLPPVLVRVFEQLDGLNETQIGQAGVLMDQYGNRSVTFEYWQLSLGTATYQVPGTTPAPAPFEDCLLKTEERTNDGTLIKIRRVYIDSGVLSDTEQLKFGGHLILREITSLGVPPATPSGWKLVTTSTEYVNGRSVYRYGFVNAGGGGGGAGGVISTKVEYKISPDQGTTGVTVTTIEYISDTTVSDNPITGPVGSELIEVGYADQDGYRLWRAVYASGQGTIISNVDLRNEGKLVIYSITAINAVPAAPDPTIGGTVTLIQSNQRNGTDAADGTVIYDYQWAEGEGVVSSETETKNGGKLAIYRITSFGTPPDEPAPTIGGTVHLISSSNKSADGYPIFDYQWAEGNGQIVFDRETKNDGRLILYHIVSLGVPADAPDPIIGGTVIQIDFEVREEDGYQLFDQRWAEGHGQIDAQVEFKNGGKLVIYSRTSFGVPPDAPDPTIGGGVVLIKNDTRSADGYIIYDYQWAEGNGTIDTGVEIKNGGKLIIYRITALGAAPTTPDPTIGGAVTLIDTDLREQDGYQIFEYRWAEGNGEIDRDIRYDQSVDTGTTGLTTITIRHLTEPGASVSPISTPSGFIKIGESFATQDGYRVWTGNYAKGTGTVSSQVRTRDDGSKVTIVTALGSTAATPAGPVSSYLVALDQDLSSGHYVNRATYINPPETRTYRKTVKNWQMPGFAYFSGTQLVLQPPTTQDILASIEVSYDTSQVTTDPFSVTKWASFFFTYTTTETATVPSQTVNGSQGLTGYLAEGGTTFGTNSDYNGVLCDSYSATKVASDPAALPTGDTIIDVDNDPYLTDLSGTVVYKRTVTTVAL